MSTTPATTTPQDRSRKLMDVGVPGERIELTAEHVRIVLTPEQADRFCVLFAVLEENHAVRNLVDAVWA